MCITQNTACFTSSFFSTMSHSIVCHGPDITWGLLGDDLNILSPTKFA